MTEINRELQASNCRINGVNCRASQFEASSVEAISSGQSQSLKQHQFLLETPSRFQFVQCDKIIQCGFERNLKL